MTLIWVHVPPADPHLLSSVFKRSLLYTQWIRNICAFQDLFHLWKVLKLAFYISANHKNVHSRVFKPEDLSVEVKQCWDNHVVSESLDFILMFFPQTNLISQKQPQEQCTSDLAMTFYIYFFLGKTLFYCLVVSFVTVRDTEVVISKC